MTFPENQELRATLRKLRGQLPPAPAGHLTSTEVAEKLDLTEADVVAAVAARRGVTQDQHGRLTIPRQTYERLVQALAEGRDLREAEGFL